MKKITHRQIISIVNIVLLLVLFFSSKDLVSDYFFNEKLVEVPNVINMDKFEAEKILKKAGLKANFISSRSIDVPINFVYSQTPEAGSFVKTRRGIKLQINDDKGLKVPEIVGMNLTEAMADLNKYKIEVKRVDYIGISSDENKVLAVYPRENTRLAYGTKLSLLVSTKETANSNVMPDLIGLDVEEAKNILTQMGYEIEEIQKTKETDYPKNLVVSTMPSVSMPILKGDKISLLVSDVDKVNSNQEEINQSSVDEIIRKALEERNTKNEGSE